jgi:hypothetical protein
MAASFTFKPVQCFVNLFRYNGIDQNGVYDFDHNSYKKISDQHCDEGAFTASERTVPVKSGDDTGREKRKYRGGHRCRSRIEQHS